MDKGIIESVRRETTKMRPMKERTKKCIPSMDKCPVATQSLPKGYEKKRKHLLLRYVSLRAKFYDCVAIMIVSH